MARLPDFIESYFDELDLGGAYRESAQAGWAQLSEHLGAELFDTAFVSESRDGDGVRLLGSLWLFGVDLVSEIRVDESEKLIDWDVMRFSPCDYLRVTQGIGPLGRNGVSVSFRAGEGVGALSATGSNGRVLLGIVKHRLAPAVARGMRGPHPLPEEN